MDPSRQRALVPLAFRICLLVSFYVRLVPSLYRVNIFQQRALPPGVALCVMRNPCTALGFFYEKRKIDGTRCVL
uniref:Uncharacterized protein n=1 Tax=Aegilops tauschii subsp. strangulata TaxID=200361 RepID=A0A453L1U1_AEGTS